MKQIMKRRVAAALAAVMALSVCATFTGCTGPAETTTGAISTIPPIGGETTTGTTPTETTTAGNVPTTTEPRPTETTTTGGGTVTPPVVGDYVNPLTGMPTVNDLSNRRPLAIVVDNIDNALPNQTGLDQADVLYEALVAPGITRFLAVYADYTLVDTVCNIRSGRDYHFAWAAQHNAVLMCHGGSNTANYDFYQMAVDRLGSRWGFIDTQQEYYFMSMEAASRFGTIDNWDERIDLKYDTLFKPAALDALLKSTDPKSSQFAVIADGDLDGKATESLKFVPYGTQKDMTGGSSATTINLKFKSQGVAGAANVSYAYDAASGKYLRSQDGKAHVDSETGKQLAFTNVLALLTDVKNAKSGIAQDPDMTLVETVVPNGIGYYFHGGKAINVTWFANGNGTFTIYDPNDNVLQMATGNTYIAYLDKSADDNGNFWN